jgi:hypothetical protein
VLRSFLIQQDRGRPVVAATEFSYVPYAMIESGDGEPSIAPACAAGAPRGGAPYPPAGHYRFFDESGGVKGTVVPADRIDADTLRIVHLPLYDIRYEAGGWKGRAAVVGESWQVIAAELPPERPRALNFGLLVVAALLFASYLAIGKFASGLLGRLALIAAVSSGGYAIFTLYEKATKHE